MNPIQVYKCLCDEQRLRILNLLQAGPLCVCHLQEILDAEQVKMSKQLSYMKKLGLVEARREANWMIYQLPDATPPLLLENLKCLQDCTSEMPHFRTDLEKRAAVIERIRCAEDQRVPAAIIENGCEGDCCE